MLAMVTSREAPSKELAELIAEEETDVTGAVKVEINDSTPIEENSSDSPFCYFLLLLVMAKYLI